MSKSTAAPNSIIKKSAATFMYLSKFKVHEIVFKGLGHCSIEVYHTRDQVAQAVRLSGQRLYQLIGCKLYHTTSKWKTHVFFKFKVS